MTNTVNKNTEALEDTSKEVDLEVNTEKIKHIVTCMIVTIDGFWIGNQIYWTH
jgi:hypothetical protein